MESLFLDDKRDEAIDYLANLIFKGSRNAATVIKKINTACQNPEKFNDPNFLIKQWNECLYTNEIFDLADDWQASVLIPSENLNEIEFEFFKYSLGLSALFYYKKKLVIRDIFSKKKYKWTEQDFNKLQSILLNLWIQNYGYKDKSEIFLIFNAVIKAKNNLLFNSKKISKSLDIDFLIKKSDEICPQNLKPYQRDMFKNYAKKFIENIPASFDLMNEHFKTMGMFLHKFFK